MPELAVALDDRLLQLRFLLTIDVCVHHIVHARIEPPRPGSVKKESGGRSNSPQKAHSGASVAMWLMLGGGGSPVLCIRCRDRAHVRHFLLILRILLVDGT